MNLNSISVIMNQLIVIFCLLILMTLTQANDETIRFPMLMPDVQPLQKETYLCTAFKMPMREHEYIVEFKPNATMNTAHHILIYGCKIPGYHERDTPRVVWDCGEMAKSNTEFVKAPTCASGSEIVYAWAMDAPALVLPEGVGFKVGGDTGVNYLVLQVHYANVEKFINGGFDDSGVILTLLPKTTKKVNKRAGVLLLGTGGVIGPKSIEHMESACAIDEPLKLHPFAFRTHTHKLGLAVAGYRITPDGKWDLVGKHNPQKPQMFYPVEGKDMTISEGDVMAARCTMNNFQSHTVRIGSTGNDEMCNFYMMYYVDGDRILNKKYCFTSGPPFYYWSTDSLVGTVPEKVDIDASVLSDNEE
jgi:peptidylglycine monooxygenase